MIVTRYEIINKVSMRWNYQNVNGNMRSRKYEYGKYGIWSYEKQKYENGKYENMET